MECVMSQVLAGIDLAVLVVTGAVHGTCDESGAGSDQPGSVWGSVQQPGCASLPAVLSAAGSAGPQFQHPGFSQRPLP